MTTFSWLHLTDFHFGLKGQDTLWPNLRQPFLDDLEKLHDLTGPWQVVLFSGDLVQQGRSEEFESMQREVLDRVWKKLEELGSGKARFLAVPGNHDLYRPDPKEDNPALDGLLDKDGFNRISAKFWEYPTGAYRNVVRDAFGAYTAWWNATSRRPDNLTPGLLPGDFSCTIDHDGQAIGIVGLNTAFLQLQGGDYREKLVWDNRQLQAVCGGAADDWLKRHSVCLLLSHHGPDWLTPEARKHGDSEISPAGRFAAHLYGHNHEADIQYIRSGGNALGIRRLQGCSVFGMERIGEPPAQLVRSHGYSVGRIEFGAEKATLRIWPRVATDQPKENGWRYIPDGQHAVLLNDNGTAPETIACRPFGSSTAYPVPTAAANTAASFVPHSTLPSRRPFFGRAKELADVAKFLHPDHQGWGVVLDGPGGMGKTALALEAAHRAPAEFYPLKLFITAKSRRLDPDGVRDLHDHRVDDYYALLTEIGLALGRDDIQRTTQEGRAELVRHALAAQRVLLVLDNLESFSREERRRIYDLLEILPAGCRAIVTSRRRDETAARTLRLDKLDFAAAQELLASLGKNSPAIAQLTEAEQRQFYAETGGNPSLLTWSAAQLGRARGRCRTVTEAVQRLHEAHRQHKIDEHNDPLEFVFGDLLDTFSADETAVLAALAYFPEPARLPWLLPLAEISESAALTALDDLRDRALLIEDEASVTWFLPPLAAHFLRQRRPEAIGVAGQRLAEEAYALAVRHGGDGNAPFVELEAAWPSIHAALPLLIGGESVRLQKVCNALFEFLDFSGRWDVRLRLSQEAQAKALAAGNYDNMGWHAAHQAGRVHWRKAGAGARKRANSIRLRGLDYQSRKDYPAALSAYQEALELWRSLNPESVDVVIGLNSLANVKQESGDQASAEADFREALSIARRIEYREGIALCTGNLAELFVARQDWPAAERWASEALVLASCVSRLDVNALNHHTLAQALLHQQRAAEALPHAREAVATYTRLRHRDLAEAQSTLMACEVACGGSPTGSA